MREKVFIDSDIILDVVFERSPHFGDSQKIISLVEKNILDGFTSSLILANCYYIISSNKNKTIAEKTISKLRSIITILPFMDKEIGESLNSNFKDFEDGVQYFVTVNNGIRIILTRNISDYKNVDIDVFSPSDFLKLKRIIKILKSEKTKKKVISKK